jgi:plastocyanin
MLLRLGVTVAVLAVLLTAAGGALAADQAVVARSAPDDEFFPAEVTINQGEKVTWTNAGGTHNVRFADGLFDQPPNPLAPPWPAVVERRFDTAGDYAYLCEQHAATMTGTVHVLPSAAPPGGSPPGVGPPGGPPSGPGPGDPGDPGAPGGPAPSPPLRITLAVSDATPAAGRLVRLFGSVRPARDGRRVQLQKRARNGDYRTVATTRLSDAGPAKSQFSLRLRISGDAVFRARVGGDDERASGVSAARKIDVHRRRPGT